MLQTAKESATWTNHALNSNSELMEADLTVSCSQEALLVSQMHLETALLSKRTVHQRVPISCHVRAPHVPLVSKMDNSVEIANSASQTFLVAASHNEHQDEVRTSCLYPSSIMIMFEVMVLVEAYATSGVTKM
jgi:hypothetical protein